MKTIIQFALVLASSTAISASHVVSGTSARLPMSLSPIINDLEAEGVSHVTTAAFLSSKSVRVASCAKLLRSLFGVSADEEEEVSYGTTMAFGKKLGTTAEAENSDEEDIGSGVAIACPPSSGSTVSEVCSTVVACGGTVVYVADPVDLGLVRDCLTASVQPLNVYWQVGHKPLLPKKEKQPQLPFLDHLL